MAVASSECPKFTFEAKELFDQSLHLCQQIPHWKGEHDNPINQYVPISERPFKNEADEDKKKQIEAKRDYRRNRLMSISNKDRSIRLAGTMALNMR